jgi:hypothetical protein
MEQNTREFASKAPAQYQGRRLGFEEQQQQFEVKEDPSAEKEQEHDQYENKWCQHEEYQGREHELDENKRERPKKGSN